MLKFWRTDHLLYLIGSSFPQAPSTNHILRLSSFRSLQVNHFPEQTVMMEPCLGLCKNRRATQGALAEIGVAIRDPLDEAHVLARADHLMSILAVLGAG